MTHSSADESNDAYKIDINLEDDEDNHRKRFFEKGLGALLDNPHFLLLHVPEDGSKMQIVQPYSDLYHRKRMIKKINEERKIPSFYYALSHLWGISKENRHLWYDISNYVDDENGQPAAPVSMRPEKRDTLIALLKSHRDSYWWIDVLCARTETPLDIMGDIYACCLGCYAMIDCEPAIISQLYTKRIESKELDDPAFKFETMRDPEFLMPYEQYYVKECPQIIDLLSTLISSEWWKRVWTWQEMALPTNVYLLAETTSYICHQQTIILDEITQLNAIMLTLYGVFKEIKNEVLALERIQPLWKWGAHTLYGPCRLRLWHIGIISTQNPQDDRSERSLEAFLTRASKLFGRYQEREFHHKGSSGQHLR
ncbi:hypothetical protein K492DRAFT_196983 [Lichtheimia hyalospora FSU 10163]|nr:hypothetical protein K492DRAFT_196983 [Lichtheimia hyalospora FSU 10163]